MPAIECPFELRPSAAPYDMPPSARPPDERLCKLLAHVPLLSGFTDAELARFAHGVRELAVDRGTVLFHRGDPCRGFHVVLCGQVKLAFTSAEGHEKVIEIIRPGQSFGEAVMFMEKPYVVMAQALTDCKLLHIAKSVVFDEMDRDPLFCRKIIAGLSQRLHHLIADVETYSMQSGRDRIIGYLLREEEFSGEPGSGGRVSVRLPTSKGTIASRLNVTQEHFSRILHELTEAGLICVEGRVIHILDIEKLRTTQARF